MAVENLGVNAGLISIALCTYNGKKHLNDQLNSILAQTYTNIELVICDDASTDGTRELLIAWQNDYPKLIKLHFNEKNLGYNQNFAKAISFCKGDYIAISDQDDIWLPDKLDKQIKCFEVDKQTILVHCASVSFNKTRFFYGKGSIKWTNLFKGDDTRKFILFNHVQGHCLIFRKELVRHILPIPNGIYYDWWIGAIATHYGKIDVVEEYLVHHRRHEDNAYFNRKFSAKDHLIANLDFAIALQKRLNGNEQTDEFLVKTIAILTNKLERNMSNFDGDLFKMLYHNRYIVFGHKKRKTVIGKEWSLLKSCYKLAKY